MPIPRSTLETATDEMVDKADGEDEEVEEEERRQRLVREERALNTKPIQGKSQVFVFPKGIQNCDQHISKKLRQVPKIEWASRAEN